MATYGLFDMDVTVNIVVDGLNGDILSPYHQFVGKKSGFTYCK